MGASPGTAPAHAADTEPPSNRPDPARVLVVDDEPDFQTLFGHYLRRLGHEVAFADHGEAALERLRREPFDLVLLDLRLPRMDGMALLHALRATPGLADLPVIVVTAHADQDTAVNCLRAGADEFLEKPVRPLVLTVRVNSVLLRRQQARRQVEYIKRLQVERDRGDALLRELLPDPIAAELKATHRVAPRRHEGVAVLFADVADFTAFSERVDPAALHADLQEMVHALEGICDRHGLEKIKTIGDCFMGVAGLIDTCDAPVLQAAGAALEMVAATGRLRAGWALRAGIDFGPVSAGIVGRRRYSYDVWGDTVNTAERVQQSARPGTVCLSRRAWAEAPGSLAGRWLEPVNAHGKPELALFEVEAVRTRRDPRRESTG